jgi:hypothetical protein
LFSAYTRVITEAHLQRLDEALAAETAGLRLVLDGGAPEPHFARAAVAYRSSYESAPPASYGRLVGMLKMAILAGDANDAAAFALDRLEAEAFSPVAAYAEALAVAVTGDDDRLRAAAARMAVGGGAFERTADGLAALAEGDRPRLDAAVAAIRDDFAQRIEHLTGVPVADTALVLERLAVSRF